MHCVNVKSIGLLVGQKSQERSSKILFGSCVFEIHTGRRGTIGTGNGIFYNTPTGEITALIKIQVH